MNASALKNIERIAREVSRAKSEYDEVSRKLVSQNKIDRALEVTDISGDLATLESMLETITDRFSPILRKLEIEVRRGRPRKLIEDEFEEDLTLLKRRGRPRKSQAEDMEGEDIDEVSNVIENEDIDEVKHIAKTVKEEDIVNEDTTRQQQKIYSVPIKMTLLGNEYAINKNWREVYINTLEEMIARKPKVVKSFATNENMQGRTMTYFSFDEKVPMVSRYKLTNGMFVNLNLSSTAILNLCYRVLSECGYAEDILKVEVENYTKNERITRKNLSL